MFDLSLPKLLVLAVIALVVFGPDELPKIAAQAGRALRDLRSRTVFPLPAGADTTVTRAGAPSRANSAGRDTTLPAPRPAARPTAVPDCVASSVSLSGGVPVAITLLMSILGPDFQPVHPCRGLAGAS